MIACELVGLSQWPLNVFRGIDRALEGGSERDHGHKIYRGLSVSYASFVIMIDNKGRALGIKWRQMTIAQTQVDSLSTRCSPSSVNSTFS